MTTKRRYPSLVCAKQYRRRVEWREGVGDGEEGDLPQQSFVCGNFDAQRIFYENESDFDRIFWVRFKSI